MARARHLHDRGIEVTAVGIGRPHNG
jgi:hypothetical protein